MSPLRRSAIAALLLLSLLPGRAACFAGSDMLDMMRTMSAMMGLWNMFSGVGQFGGLNYPNSQFGSQFGPQLGSQPGLPGSPAWGSGSNPWGSGLDMPPPPVDYSMDGEWISEDGGTLMFRDDRFLLNNGRGDMLEGSFMIFRNRLIAYVYPSEDVLVFSFERRGDYFVVQNEEGWMMMFKRVPPWQSGWN